MAFFKFRNAGDESTAAPQPGESVEVMRKRARHRLIGAAVLVLVGVLGFPLIFDSQPRPIPVDIPIEIPDKNKAKPLVIPAAPVADAGASAAGNAPAAALSAPVATAPKATAPVAPQVSSGKVGGAVAAPEALETASKVASVAPDRASAAKSEPAKPQPKVADKPESKPAPAKADEAAKVQALLEGKPVPAPAAATSSAGDERYIVQIGAFADAAKVREVRQKLERAGLKTFTQVATTPEGARTRVRLGPFSKKVEAEAAAQKVKKLDLAAAILTL
jgi:DedD protein